MHVGTSLRRRKGAVLPMFGPLFFLIPNSRDSLGEYVRWNLFDIDI